MIFRTVAPELTVIAASVVTGAGALFAVSDVVWQALIAAVVTIVVTYLGKRIETKVETTAKAAAVAVVEVKAAAEEVRETLKSTTATTDAKLDTLVKVGEATHTLVNSAMGAQLRLHAETARAKAAITNNRGDIVVAELAEKMLSEHISKQAVVDSGQTTSVA